MFYDKIAAPPRPGSLQEALCVLIQRYRQEQRYYKTLAMLHQQGSDEQQEMFDAYKRAMYPYIESTGRDERDRTREILEEAYLRGPIFIKSLSDEEKYKVSDD